MDSPVVCPYCGDQAIEGLPGAELIATNTPEPHLVATGKIYRCSAWHIFATFPKQLVHELAKGA